MRWDELQVALHMLSHAASLPYATFRTFVALAGSQGQISCNPNHAVTCPPGSATFTFIEKSDSVSVTSCNGKSLY